MSSTKRNNSRLETDLKLAKKPRKDGCSDHIENTDDGYATQLDCSASESILAGTIMKICLKNFMCHSNLEIGLNQRVNFIVGRNGSGKSAILTALVIALGGTASATNRGSSVKEFVKKGAPSASIEVTINNKGNRGYKREEYGDKITICRTLSTSGQSTYRIKASNGEIKSTRKDELDRIVSYLNIQVNNPICILNQDTARTFLSSSDAAEKFRLYYRATQLQAVEETYESTLKSFAEAQRIYSQKIKACDALIEEINSLKKKGEFYNSIDTYNQKIVSLENERFWALAIQAEKLCNERLEEMQAEMALCPELKENVDKCEVEIEELLTSNRSAVSELNRLESEETEVMGRLNLARDKKKDAERAAHEKQKQYRHKEKMIQQYEMDIRTLNQEIEKITNMSGSNSAAEKRKLEETIHKVEQEIQQIDAMLKTADHDYHQQRATISQYTSDQQSLITEEREVMNEIDSKTREMNLLLNESKDSFCLYGRHMPTLLSKIDEFYEKRKFDKKPVGPLGAYIKLKDSSWAPAIEGHLSIPFLSSFCVHSSKDSRVLKGIFDSMRLERRPNILIGKFFDKVHDVRPHHVVTPGYQSLFDALIISDPVVANCIIDHKNVESVLLIPTSDEAHRIMSNRAVVPRNCRLALTKKGDLYYPDPNYKSYAGSGSEIARILQVNKTDVIRNLREEISLLKGKLKHIQTQSKSMADRIKQEQSQLHKINANRNNFNRNKLNLSKTLSSLRDNIEPESNSMSTLIDELNDTEKKKLTAEEDYKNLKQQYEQLVEESKKYKSEAERLFSDNQHIISKVRNLRETIYKNESEIRERNTKLAAFRSKYEMQIAKIEHLRADLRNREKRRDSHIATASAICPRIETTRPHHVINDELINLKQYIQSMERQQGATKEDVIKALEEKKAKYSEVEKNTKILRKIFKRLPEIIDDRGKLLNYLKKYISVRVQCAFVAALQQRNYDGTVNIDTEKGLLTVSACPASTKGRNVGDLKTLSGGERSFSTVSLITALWSVVEPPFYFLDEFDVFMDKLNRRVVLEVLLANAADTGFQYVFLTPQDTSSVMPSPSITIHRMEDPKRGNSQTS